MPFYCFYAKQAGQVWNKVLDTIKVSSKHVYNILPYLSAVEKEQRNRQIFDKDVVMRLSSNLNKNGQRHHKDNFFTCVHLVY